MSAGFRRTGSGAVPGAGPRGRRVRALLLALLLAPWMAGCGRATLGRVAVYRAAPDTLLVEVAPEASPLRRPLDTLTITVSDGRGFVVAERRVPARAAPVWRVPVPDARLPSRGRVMVEVCGRVGARLVCEQRPVAASPKRVRATARLAYPAAGDRERVAVQVAAAFERHTGTRWEPVPDPAGLAYALHVWVDGAPQDGLVVPIRAARDTVQLTAGPGYDPYWIRLNERVFYGEGARVHLAVRASWAGGTADVAHVVRTVRPPTDRERRASIDAFARGAAWGIARTLGVPPDSATARVEGWRFDRIRQRYTLDLALALRDTAGVPMGMTGRLEVGESGQDAVFREASADSTRPPLVLRLGRLRPVLDAEFNRS